MSLALPKTKGRPIENSQKIVAAAALSSVLALGVALSSTAAVAAEKEKCYGVAKAGHNHCATNTSSCVGHSTEDGQSDAFIVLPGGVCERLTGGSLASM